MSPDSKKPALESPVRKYDGANKRMQRSSPQSSPQKSGAPHVDLSESPPEEAIQPNGRNLFSYEKSEEEGDVQAPPESPDGPEVEYFAPGGQNEQDRAVFKAQMEKMEGRNEQWTKVEAKKKAIASKAGSSRSKFGNMLDAMGVTKGTSTADIAATVKAAQASKPLALRYNTNYKGGYIANADDIEAMKAKVAM